MGDYVEKLNKYGYSYKTPVKKILLNQFGAAMLGIMLSSACLNNKFLNLVTSIFAIFFYMFLQYTAIWDIGAKEKIRVEGGRSSLDKSRGLKCSLYANIPNIVLTLVTVLFFSVNILSSWEWSGNVAIVAGTINRFWQGMFNGVVVNIVPAGLNKAQTVLSQLIYLITIIPSLLVCTVGYINGLNGRRILPQRKSK